MIKMWAKWAENGQKWAKTVQKWPKQAEIG